MNKPKLSGRSFLCLSCWNTLSFFVALLILFFPSEFWSKCLFFSSVNQWKIFFWFHLFSIPSKRNAKFSTMERVSLCCIHSTRSTTNHKILFSSMLWLGVALTQFCGIGIKKVIRIYRDTWSKKSIRSEILATLKTQIKW